jgi:flotillin
MEIALIAIGVLLFGLLAGVLIAMTNLVKCPPNQVLIFAGPRKNEGGRSLGYRIVKGRTSWRNPFLEKVYRMDLSNMIIELSATNAYAKGGIPLQVQGVANIKIASTTPQLYNAIERFLGKDRQEIVRIAKSTLEGALRGVLATMTPEELNEDRGLFDERVMAEAGQDMAALGLEVATVKIQNITDDVKYLDSIGRIRNAELVSSARIAEALARADSKVTDANNRLQEVQSQIKARMTVAQADAERALADARTRRAALVAEEEGAVAELVAKAESDMKVQEARVEQVRRQLDADVVAPAKANLEAMEQSARAGVAPIVEDGRARAEALTRLAESWNQAGDQAREIFLIQKLKPIVGLVTDAIGSTQIDKVTVIDSSVSGGSGADPRRLLAMNEQFKEVFGIDIAEKVRNFGEEKDQPSSARPRPWLEAREPEEAPAPPTVPPQLP